MKLKYYCIFFYLIFFKTNLIFAQIHYRIEADFSIKEIGGNNKSLIMGRVYYDVYAKQIVYDINIPEKYKIVINDHFVYTIKNEVVTSKVPAPSLLSHSVFKLSLDGNLPYYGLKESLYQLQEVKSYDGMTVSTWLLPPNKSKNESKIVLSQKDGQLNAIVSFKNQTEVVSKQFFEDYSYAENLLFPCRIVQFYYKNGEEEKKISTFKNIIVNNKLNESFYNYIVPAK